MASIEDLLMYKIQEDAASVPSQGTALLAGASLGALPGLVVGDAVHQAGNNVNTTSLHLFLPSTVKPPTMTFMQCILF